MATTLKTKLLLQLQATYKNVLDLGSPTDSFEKRQLIELSNGTGSNAADLMFHDRRTLAASGTEDLDLAGTALQSPFGANLTFVEVRAVLITAASGNTNNVRVTRPASNGVPLFVAAGDGIDVPPGGAFCWVCPADGKVTVTPATGDLITVTNGAAGSSVTYDVVILGTSA
jgi:hypothetical protein